jgi:hypothetical protein
MERAAVQGPAPDKKIILPTLPDLLKDPGVWKKGQVQGGDSMGSILSREGLNAEQSDDVIRALRTRMDLQKIRPGQRYELWISADKKVRLFSFHVGNGERIVVLREPGGGFQVNASPH